MSDSLTGMGGKPMLGREGPDKHFVGRVIIELFEGPNIDSDAHGFVMSISPALTSSLSQQELLKRIAAALPDRVALRERTNPEKVKEEYIKNHTQDQY